MTACSETDCERNTHVGGLCASHWRRARDGSDTPIRRATKTGQWGHWYNDGAGYVIRRRQVNGVREYQRQHTLVMEEKLGRKLVKGESVHHRNGVRSDNRPENLELWLVKQPYGQRVEDLVVWAREILDMYGDMP